MAYMESRAGARGSARAHLKIKILGSLMLILRGGQMLRFDAPRSIVHVIRGCKSEKLLHVVIILRFHANRMDIKNFRKKSNFKNFRKKSKF